MCERWVEDWTKTATYWPLALLAIAALLFHSAGLLNRGSLRATSPLSGSWFSLPRTATSWLQLTELPVAPGYIIVWNHLLPVSVTFAPNLTRPQSRLSPDIFDQMHLFPDRRLGRRSICYINIQEHPHLVIAK